MGQRLRLARVFGDTNLERGSSRESHVTEIEEFVEPHDWGLSLAGGTNGHLLNLLFRLGRS